MKKLLLIGCIPLVMLVGCGEKDISNKEVKVYNADGDSLGNIKLKEVSDGVEITYQLKGLPPGEHGVHIHEKGVCKAPTFKTAGNHLNPDDKKHGLLHPDGPEAGDLKNIIVKDDGTFDGTDMAPEVTLKEGKAPSLKRWKALLSLLQKIKMMVCLNHLEILVRELLAVLLRKNKKNKPKGRLKASFFRLRQSSF